MNLRLTIFVSPFLFNFITRSSYSWIDLGNQSTNPVPNEIHSNQNIQSEYKPSCSSDIFQGMKMFLSPVGFYYLVEKLYHEYVVKFEKNWIVPIEIGKVENSKLEISVWNFQIFQSYQLNLRPNKFDPLTE